MEVKFKKLHPAAYIPSYANTGDAGLDLICIGYGDNHDGVQTLRTGIAVEIPEGYVGLLYPRSSISKYGLTMCNSVGVIDSGYRGEILVKFRILSVSGQMYLTGDKIAQLIITPIPTINPVEVTVLSESERGTGGFGSTGR